MTAGRSDRRLVRIRRRGRHASPSQVEKVAQQAGKAAPAFAIAGALVAVPQAQQALASSAKPVTATATAQGHHAAASPERSTATTAALDSYATRTVTVASTTPARHAAAASSTYYQVRSGDSLSTIADQYYHNADDWQYLYHENAKTVSDPNLIYAGQSLYIPATVPANFTLTNYVPKHAKPATAPVTSTASTTSTTSSDSAGSGGYTGGSSYSANSYSANSYSGAATSASTTSASTTSGSGTSGSGTTGGGTAGGSTTGGSTAAVQSAPQALGSYSCSALEQLWEQAGGNAADAFMAAEIAMAESGGNPNAISPTSDYGLWQINSSNGALATLNPFQNAKSAVTLSGGGANWGPWTTYTSGAYSGKC